MLDSRLWARLLGVEGMVVEGVALEIEEVVVKIRPQRRERKRCGVCRRRCPGYDGGQGRRRWRALDLGTTFAYIEAEAPRVKCRRHGVVVSAVPWARHDSGFTRGFEDQVAWLATECSKTAASELMRISWRTVGRIVTRVSQERERLGDRFANLRRIGIDEISYRKGQRYLMVVVDHDTGLLVWAAPGRDAKSLAGFFRLLGEERCQQIELVSADGADWIAAMVWDRCQNAEICLDPFHVVQWATAALDEVRREVWNQARRSGHKTLAKELKGARFALWKNPEDLTARQRSTLAQITKTNQPLYRAYLLKEQLRQVFRLPKQPALRMLEDWLIWARRCRLKPFVELAKNLRTYLPDIENTLAHRLSNALVESTNTKIRLIIRRAFGFHGPDPIIALAMLSLGGLCPPLPGRA